MTRSAPPCPRDEITNASWDAFISVLRTLLGISVGPLLLFMARPRSLLGNHFIAIFNFTAATRRP